MQLSILKKLKEKIDKFTGYVRLDGYKLSKAYVINEYPNATQKISVFSNCVYFGHDKVVDINDNDENAAECQTILDEIRKLLSEKYQDNNSFKTTQAQINMFKFLESV